MFRPVLAVHGSRQVFEQVKQAIDDRTIEPGSRLPSERELSATFGVSRTTIREAIKSLASLGLLEVRQGVGTIVSPGATTLEDPSYWLPWLAAHRDDVVALLQVREALEAKSAALAAEAVATGRSGSGDLISRMAGNLRQMEEAARSGDTATLERVDLEFHALLAELSGNRYLLRLSRSINHVLADRRAAMAIPGRAEKSLLEHSAIVAAVRRGEGPLAGQAMTAHLASVRSAVSELEGRGGGE